MSKEMLFLCDVYDNWLDKNDLPHRSACDILYGEMLVNSHQIKHTGQRVLSLHGILLRSIAK